MLRSITRFPGWYVLRFMRRLPYGPRQVGSGAARAGMECAVRTELASGPRASRRSSWARTAKSTSKRSTSRACPAENRRPALSPSTRAWWWWGGSAQSMVHRMGIQDLDEKHRMGLDYGYNPRLCARTPTQSRTDRPSSDRSGGLRRWSRAPSRTKAVPSTAKPPARWALRASESPGNGRMCRRHAWSGSEISAHRGGFLCRERSSVKNSSRSCLPPGSVSSPAEAVDLKDEPSRCQCRLRR